MEDNKKNKSITSSSTAEYLTFIAATGEAGVNAIYADENIWLTQKIMAQYSVKNTLKSNYNGLEKFYKYKYV